MVPVAIINGLHARAPTSGREGPTRLYQVVFYRKRWTSLRGRLGNAYAGALPIVRTAKAIYDRPQSSHRGKCPAEADPDPPSQRLIYTTFAVGHQPNAATKTAMRLASGQDILARPETAGVRRRSRLPSFCGRRQKGQGK